MGVTDVLARMHFQDQWDMQGTWEWNGRENASVDGRERIQGSCRVRSLFRKEVQQHGLL